MSTPYLISSGPDCHIRRVRCVKYLGIIVDDTLIWCTFQILGVSGSEDRGGGDTSFQFINIGRVGDKRFKEWRRKIGGWKGVGDNNILTFFMLQDRQKKPL